MKTNSIKSVLADIKEGKSYGYSVVYIGNICCQVSTQDNILYVNTKKKLEQFRELARDFKDRGNIDYDGSSITIKYRNGRIGLKVYPIIVE